MRFKTIVFALIGSLIAFSSCEKEDAEDIIVTIQTNDTTIVIQTGDTTGNPNLDSRLIGNWHKRCKWQDDQATWKVNEYLLFSSQGLWSGYAQRDLVSGSTAPSWIFEREDYGGSYWTQETVTDTADGYLMVEDRILRYYFSHQGDSLFIENWEKLGGFNNPAASRKFGRE